MKFLESPMQTMGVGFVLTIVLVVDANAQQKIPNKPKIFRIVLEIASARGP